VRRSLRGVEVAGLHFPRFYIPRPYQQELHAMWRKKRIGIAVLPRQSGKDVAMSMEECSYLLENPKTAGVYVAPDTPAVREILWEKMFHDENAGQQIQLLQDNIPESLVSWKNTR